MTIAPISKKSPSITVYLTPEDHDLIRKFACRCGTSVSQVTKIALLRLVCQAERGEIAMLPEFREGPVTIGNA